MLAGIIYMVLGALILMGVLVYRSTIGKARRRAQILAVLKAADPVKEARALVQKEAKKFPWDMLALGMSAGFIGIGLGSIVSTFIG